MSADRVVRLPPGRGPVRGFTLIELMIAVVIVSILLTLAVPSYREYVRRGAVAEAVAAIGSGRIVAEQFFLDHRAYVDPVSGDEPACPANTRSFTIDCDFEADEYTITATGIDGLTGFVYTIDEANLRTTAGPWGSGNCWITRKGDGC